MQDTKFRRTKKARELLSQAIQHGLPEELYPKWAITD